MSKLYNGIMDTIYIYVVNQEVIRNYESSYIRSIKTRSVPYYSSFFLLCYIYIPRGANIVQNSNDYMHRVPTQAKRGKVALNRGLVNLRIGNYALDDQGWYPIEME